MKAAVIGIGSNSLRMLAADIHNSQMNAILRDRIGLRVFASLDANNNIALDMIENACHAIMKMKSKALGHDIHTISLIATSAVRDANNQSEFAQAILQSTGLQLEICSGDEEAKLSFIGATEGKYAGMIDIGGGSTELVIGEKRNIEFACSLQAGAVRFFKQKSIQSIEDALDIKEKTNLLLNQYVPKIQHIKKPTQWVGVGGTFTAVASIVQSIPWDISHGIHGFSAKQSDVLNALSSLSVLTVDERTRLCSIPPDRSDIIVHGLAILLGCMETLDIPAITVSNKTNLDGYLQQKYC